MSSDTVVLRRVYALDSNTNQTMSANMILVTNSNGGTTWTDIFSSLNSAGGSSIGYLPSTLQTLSTGIYENTSTFTTYFSTVDSQISTLSSLVDGFVQNGVSPAQLASTVGGLGSAGYVSSFDLVSTVGGLGSAGYISSQQLLSTTDGLLNNLVVLGFISAPSLFSTVAGLGTAGYVSSLSLTSTVNGLGTAGYVSSFSLFSTVAGLGTAGYISSQTLQSTFNNLGASGFISSLSLNSTVFGLGTAGYVSSQQLLSTTLVLTNFISNVSVSKANIQFDITGTVNVYGNNDIVFCNVGNIIYLSTFFFSSIPFSGNTGVSLNANITNFHILDFSSINFDLSPFDPYMVSSSLVTLDFYPQIAFSKLATGANAPAMITMSSFLQNGVDQLLDTTVTNHFLASQTYFFQSPSVYYTTSNVFTSPIKMTINASSIVGRTANPFTLTHVLPSSLNNGGFQNALHNCNVSPYFGNPGGLYVSIQNIPNP